MAESFVTVAQQVVVLFLLIGVGVACAKRKMLQQTAVKSLADLVLVVVTPCVIVQSFQRRFDPAMLRGLGIACLTALLVHAATIVIVRLVFRDPDVAKRRVLRFGTVFSNAGYMSLPLQQALLGDTGVFYGAAYVAAFNLILWSYGVLEMSGDKTSLSPKKLLFNPGMIGIAIGLVLFLCSVQLPEIVAAPIRHLAALNTPVPMIIVGFYLSETNLWQALRDKRSYISIAIRLIAVPAVTLTVMWLCGIRGVLLVACVIAASAPSAAATTMFATRYGQDTALSVNMVSLSTLASLITMPVIVGIAQIVA